MVNRNVDMVLCLTLKQTNSAQKHRRADFQSYQISGRMTAILSPGWKSIVIAHFTSKLKKTKAQMKITSFTSLNSVFGFLLQRH